MDKLKSPVKSFVISKWEVWEAYREVRANRGAPGVDGQSIEDFEKDLQGNLYKVWNRMSSGTHFPSAVLRPGETYRHVMRIPLFVADA